MNTFTEFQRFNQPLMYVIFVFVLITTLIPIYFVSQENELQPRETQIIMWTGLLPVAIFSFLFFVLQLRTQIDKQGIHYGFFPFRRNLKLIPWRDIQSCEVVQYNPLRDYGGWGYRFGRKGKALNIRGNKGIQIEFVGGKKLLIGTQKPQEAQRAIDRFFIR